MSGTPPNSPPNHPSQSESKEVDILLSEFAALRAEILHHLNTARANLGFYLIAIGATIGVALSNQNFSFDAMILIAIVAPLFWMTHLATRTWVALLGDYIGTELTTDAQRLGSNRSLNWESWCREVLGRKKLVARIIDLGLDGTGRLIYSVPSFIALSITYHGAYQDLEITVDPKYFVPSEVWWLLVVLNVGMFFACAHINRLWDSGFAQPGTVQELPSRSHE